MPSRYWLGALGAAGLILWSAGASASPRHDACADAGDGFFFGVSSYGDLRDWAGAANAQGAEFKMLYVYILAAGMENPPDFEHYYVRPFAETAISIGATPVFTFYQLLDIGKAAGFTGSESAIVQVTLDDDAAMRTYFDNFVWLLKIADTLEKPPLIQVEPDSWGFMMWAFGVEGNADATSVPVSVASSGLPELAGFPNHAGGFGQALLALRDQYAPEARMGFHASNFRSGTRPEVVAGFYQSVGEWDVLVSEEPHVAGPNWWEPWPEDALATNLDWMKSVTDAAGVPMLLWQMSLGFEGQLLNPALDPRNVERFAQAGVVGLLFEHIAHRGETDPDLIRADGDAGAVPPPDAPTDGTAGGMRAEMVTYAAEPQPWPNGSLCATGSGGSGGSEAGAPSTGGTGGDTPGSGGSPAGRGGSTGGTTGGSTSGGSGGTAQAGSAMGGAGSSGAATAGAGPSDPSTATGGKSASDTKQTSAASTDDGSCACSTPGGMHRAVSSDWLKAAALLAFGVAGRARRKRHGGARRS